MYCGEPAVHEKINHITYDNLALREARRHGDLSSNKAVSVVGRKRISWQAVAQTRNRVVMIAFAIGSCSLTKKRMPIDIAKKIMITRTASNRYI